MKTFNDIFQCFQEISVINDNDMNTKEKAIIVYNDNDNDNDNETYLFRHQQLSQQHALINNL